MNQQQQQNTYFWTKTNEYILLEILQLFIIVGFFTERIFLFVVNHAPDGDRIEKFEYKVTDKTLEYIRSYKDEAIRM